MEDQPSSPSLSPSPSPSPPPFRALPPPSLLSLNPPPLTKPQSPPPKKSPSYPWTHNQTLALIHSYQHKWYSLKKGHLKAFQWDQVSLTVASLCAFDQPPKTSTQCRHKIEKLRKRYRSELKKPYPNSWQYFDYMDQLENGPIIPLKFSAVVNSLANNFTPDGYASLYSDPPTDYYLNSNNHADESDEDWNAGYNSVEPMPKTKLKSINCVSLSQPNGYRAMGRGSVGDAATLSRDEVNGKRNQYFVDVGNNDDDDEEEEEDEDEDDDSVDGLEEEQRAQAGEGRNELASEIKGFADTFMRMESWKIEIMQEMERQRMEMEKKRMDMILDNQLKIIDTIGRTFGSCKKARMDHEY